MNSSHLLSLQHPFPFPAHTHTYTYTWYAVYLCFPKTRTSSVIMFQILFVHFSRQLHHQLLRTSIILLLMIHRRNSIPNTTTSIIMLKITITIMIKPPPRTKSQHQPPQIHTKPYTAHRTKFPTHPDHSHTRTIQRRKQAVRTWRPSILRRRLQQRATGINVVLRQAVPWPGGTDGLGGYQGR